jgi:hypothetical protein
MTDAIFARVIGAAIGVTGTLLGTFMGALLTRGSARKAREEQRIETQRYREAQISAAAFALRHQLKSWLRESHSASVPHESHAAGWARDLTPHFGPAEDRACLMAGAASDISSERATAARSAFALFCEATVRLNAAGARPGALDSVNEARIFLEVCIGELEKAIDPVLLRAEDAIYAGN